MTYIDDESEDAITDAYRRRGVTGLNERDEDARYPVGSKLLCYECKPLTGVEQLCTALGPVTNRADPTQTYRLACGHLAI